MKDDYQTVYDTLHRIYQTHRRKHRENSDSKQMCCMWSTDDPPDSIEGTDCGTLALGGELFAASAEAEASF